MGFMGDARKPNRGGIDPIDACIPRRPVLCFVWKFTIAPVCTFSSESRMLSFTVPVQTSANGLCAAAVVIVSTNRATVTSLAYPSP
jgi:hypothetical protein